MINSLLKKLFVLAVFSTVLIIGSGKTYACMDFIGTLSDGTPVFISCGSSAGNYAMNIDAEGILWESGAEIDQYCNSCGSCYTACLGGIAGVIAANCQPRTQMRNLPVLGPWKMDKSAPNRDFVY